MVFGTYKSEEVRPWLGGSFLRVSTPGPWQTLSRGRQLVCSWPSTDLDRGAADVVLPLKQTNWLGNSTSRYRPWLHHRVVNGADLGLIRPN